MGPTPSARAPPRAQPAGRAGAARRGGAAGDADTDTDTAARLARRHRRRRHRHRHRRRHPPPGTSQPGRRRAAGLQPQPHVPFRDSKLTRVLKDSLGGNSFTCLLACLHPTPDNADECGATLQFAVRCSALASAPTVNVLGGVLLASAVGLCALGRRRAAAAVAADSNGAAAPAPDGAGTAEPPPGVAKRDVESGDTAADRDSAWAVVPAAVPPLPPKRMPPRSASLGAKSPLAGAPLPPRSRGQSSEAAPPTAGLSGADRYGSSGSGGAAAAAAGPKATRALPGGEGGGRPASSSHLNPAYSGQAPGGPPAAVAASGSAVMALLRTMVSSRGSNPSAGGMTSGHVSGSAHPSLPADTVPHHPPNLPGPRGGAVGAAAAAGRGASGPASPVPGMLPLAATSRTAAQVAAAAAAELGRSGSQSKGPNSRPTITENPELWADLQRRAGRQPGASRSPPPPPPPPSRGGGGGGGDDSGGGSAADPAPKSYDAQVDEWLRNRRERANGGFEGGGGKAGMRQDDEVAGLALTYLAVAVPLLVLALATAW
ncbi:Osmotic avoidance abnormal protein 3 [Tetrabaena socialis]|uniref:Osmotic avoidance abnormal protein 3 n=1 Tax=Tetrabaena socialis TaxID=47790 RepID=A0A2J8A421_9CHLO|nr:Osmotic avoidance abnormal protein 3 [Tetrabaena socialis]|eukprot:PNH07264.1 Osmotic avoidance abnormal protein 3 [Tetrabaena socialis]